jgi:hypothetical protein
MKKINWLVWIPLFGLLFMWVITKGGRYSTIYFAGTIWLPYQILWLFIILISTAVILK